MILAGLGAWLFWRIACPIAYTNHVRDWIAWDSMGLSRCKHCKHRMDPPPFDPMARL